jgi:hypothetical protein
VIQSAKTRIEKMRSDEKAKSNNIKTKSEAKQTQFQKLVEERKAKAYVKNHKDDKPPPSAAEQEAKEERRAAFITKKERER